MYLLLNLDRRKSANIWLAVHPSWWRRCTLPVFSSNWSSNGWSFLKPDMHITDNAACLSSERSLVHFTRLVVLRQSWSACPDTRYTKYMLASYLVLPVEQFPKASTFLRFNVLTARSSATNSSNWLTKIMVMTLYEWWTITIIEASSFVQASTCPYNRMQSPSRYAGRG